MWKAIASRAYLRRLAVSIKPDQKTTSGSKQASRADLEKVVSIILQFKYGTQHLHQLQKHSQNLKPEKQSEIMRKHFPSDSLYLFHD